MPSLGHIVDPTSSTAALARARQRAALVPDCLVEAQRIANTVIAGWHGRRKRGIGENFWQFRPYVPGESVAKIDWRRSARDDHTYLRDREWEAAHTLWLWADASASMLFKSDLARTSKEARALVLELAIAEVLARSGERIGSPGVMEPISARNAAERLATALSLQQTVAGFPDFADIGRHSEIVLIGDFLDPAETVLEKIVPIAHRGLRGHVIEICDPVEEAFPYAGRTEFRDPETGRRLTAGRAETLAEDYRQAYLARRAELSERLKRLGWTFMTHRTDRPASEALVTIHMALSGEPGAGRKAG